MELPYFWKYTNQLDKLNRIMRIGSIVKTGIILLAILGTILIVCTLNDDNGGYIVTPANVPIGEDEIVDNSGADKEITFWELPLWVQIYVITGLTVPTFAFIKYFPILLGKISAKRTNPKLEKIVSYITDNPGCLESEISRDLDLKRGTLRYYLSELSAEDRIQITKKGNVKGIFHVTCSKTEDEKLLHLHRKNENRKKIIEIITKKPGITGQELSSALNIDKSTVHWHVKELHEDDIIKFKKDGRYKKYYPQALLLSDDNY